MADEEIAAAVASDGAGQMGCGPLRVVNDSALPLRLSVFEAVRAHGAIPRVELARTLGVSPASVTAATTDLIAAGYLLEIDAVRDGDTGRGRPPVALAVRAQAGYVAGIKFSEAAHTAVIHDFAGTPLAEITLRSGALSLSLGDLVDQSERLLNLAVDKAGLNRAQISAVGVGLPGYIDSDLGHVLWSPLMRNTNAPLCAMIRERLNCPVIIDNDANLVTLAELWFGGGRSVSNFAVVTIEHGVGMGLVLNNRLYRGARGLGTELGHTKVHLDGALCRCGQRGCLEAYVADYALVREASTALNWAPGSAQNAHMLESLYSHAKAGNPAARSIFRRAGRYLAVGIGNIINLFDPELILLSGERMRYDYLYADEVLAELANVTIQVDRPAPRVEIHAWGDMVWARGAAALAMAHITTELLGAGGLVAAQ
ncbi:ROK family transcriptional regulator [Oceaniglobus ichthyenteri]|uniref:ROK family transcriptional regulator n=1 Tax=Oceaniglobus ichthyenteri TaxID=2136177 RepID=UPI001F0CB185|nr:ROK family protein [Oceaniglobus ichthyenteri]